MVNADLDRRQRNPYSGVISDFDARAICNERVLGNLVRAIGKEFRDPLIPNRGAAMREIAVEYVDSSRRRTELLGTYLESVSRQYSQCRSVSIRQIAGIV